VVCCRKENGLDRGDGLDGVLSLRKGDPSYRVIIAIPQSGTGFDGILFAAVLYG
jgi:hypothetical protein